MLDWISVNDDLPKDSSRLWIAYKNDQGDVWYTCGIYTGYGTPFGNWIDEVGKRKALNPPKATVTHWIKLPHLPET